MAPPTTTKVDIAVGVLNTITRGKSPAQPDLAALSFWVEAEERLLRPEELARLVLNRELSQRRQKAAGSSTS